MRILFAYYNNAAQIPRQISQKYAPVAKKMTGRISARQRPSKNPLKGLFRRTTALRALIVGYADNSHTCAVSSVFCLGRAEAKNGFQKLAS